jgi:hypothetical protein
MGHVEDRWWNSVTDPATGKPGKVKTARFGRGCRYRVRYVDPEGKERSASFPDRQKKAAEDFLLKIEGDKRQGVYIDPTAGRLMFDEFVETWLASQTFDVSTRNSVTWRLNAQILPFFRSRQLGAIRPTDVRAWIRAMQERNVAASYQAGCFAHLSSILSAAVDDKLIRENPCHARTVVRPRPVPPTIVPWSRTRIVAMRLAMADRYKIVMCSVRAVVCGRGSCSECRRTTSTVRPGFCMSCVKCGLSTAVRPSRCPSGTRPATSRSRAASCDSSTSTWTVSSRSR